LIVPGLTLDAGFVLIVLGASFIPIAITLAILRHRAFDIDRIINRTVSYAIVSAFLGGTFALIIVLPTSLLGAGRDSPWTVAVATLAAAALFRPVRNLVRDAVDRRFNRSRYDAVRTIESFASRLREEIDIDALTGELANVVFRTMQPSRVSLWMSPRAGRSDKP